MADTITNQNLKLYRKTISGAVSSSGALTSGLDVSVYFILSVRMLESNGYVFWRGRDAYLTFYNNAMSLITSGNVKAEIVYCRRDKMVAV